jgi:hypothetical protein
MIKLLVLQTLELFCYYLHLSSTPVFSGVRVTRSLALYVCFVDRCLKWCQCLDKKVQDFSVVKQNSNMRISK